MKIYALMFQYNEYDQLSAYTVALFAKKPDFQTLTKWFSEATDNPYGSPYSEGRSRQTCIDMLARGEDVWEYPTGGGDGWWVEEIEVVE